MPNFKNIRDSAVRWAVFGASAALFMAGAAYALTYDWSDPAALRGKTPGNQLLSSQWNLLVGNVDNLNERLSGLETAPSMPTGAVVSFFWTACPAGWSPADGTSNGVKKTDGTSGTLDLRWEFVRGLDSAWAWARNVDPGRTLWTGQPATEVLHGWGDARTVSTRNYDSRTGASYNRVSWTDISGATHYWDAVRPRNVALLYCVKD